MGQAFDLAVAARALRDGRLPASVEHGTDPWRSAAGEPLAGELTCLKCDGRGNYGAIVVERG